MMQGIAGLSETLSMFICLLVNLHVCSCHVNDSKTYGLITAFVTPHVTEEQYPWIYTNADSNLGLNNYVQILVRTYHPGY